MEENIRNMIEELADEIDTYKNKWAEKYFNTLRENGINIDDDAVFDIFNDMMDGYNSFDIDEAVNAIMNLIEIKIDNLLTQKINEVFLMMQKELDIKNGDIEPLDFSTLKTEQYRLATTIGKIIRKQEGE